MQLAPTPLETRERVAARVRDFCREAETLGAPEAPAVARRVQRSPLDHLLRVLKPRGL